MNRSVADETPIEKQLHRFATLSVIPDEGFEETMNDLLVRRAELWRRLADR